jgi:hypothetical protein
MDKVDTEEVVDIVGEGELIYVPRNDAVAAKVTANELIITTRDSRTIHTPLSWFPFLLNANEDQRQNFQVMGTLILWDDLDEVVTMEVILLGRSGT